MSSCQEGGLESSFVWEALEVIKVDDNEDELDENGFFYSGVTKNVLVNFKSFQESFFQCI